jgi:hypothetical protein
MAKTREPIPKNLRIGILTRNKHRCCICCQEQVVLHHIDKNPDNNAIENLAVLCLHHHGLAHAHFDLAQNYTEEIIRAHKKDWEDRIERGAPLPPAIVEPVATHLSRQYERQQTALRIVVAEELLKNYTTARDRYVSAGGAKAGLDTHTLQHVPRLHTARWDTLTDLGHLQEYVELLARTYAAVGDYNQCLAGPTASHLSALEWADWNLRVGTAIAMSLSPLLLSLDRPAIDVLKDFNSDQYLRIFPQEEGAYRIDYRANGGKEKGE